MQIGILGPLQVRDGSEHEVTGSRLRTLLIRLAMDAGRPVSAAALSDAVWGDQPPADEANALQSLVSRLRRALGGGHLVAQSPAGYRLAVRPDDVDAHRFERLARAGAAALRGGDHDRAAGLLREALALWRGPALADADGAPFAVATEIRLAELRLVATIDRIEADTAMGRANEVVAELEALAEEHPLNERLTAQLLATLCAAGRPADALTAYERLRTRLADELGADPSAELQARHLAVLRGEVGPVPLPSQAPTRRTNLPAQLTSFVGRDDDVARIAKVLGESRLATLVGPGGAGKTRLASEAVAGLVDAMPDGIWFVALASVADAADVPQTVLSSLGLREAYLLDRTERITPRDALGRLLESLPGKELLLVLDNCEHLIEACAQLAGQLLAACPDLRILATSREPLGITGESLIAVPPLGQPVPGADPAQALQYPAVRLFADRAAAVRPDFAVDQASVASVVEIVRRLDGLPLAIELAAARLRSLPVHEIAARLSDRFRLLTGGSRTALPRHRTLRAVVDWSWELLTPAERLLAERLAVFPAGVSVASAEAICADGALPAEEVLDTLSSLVDKSLLQEAGDGRYRMLETIREYGVERLAECGELAGVRQAHAGYFADLVQQAEPHLRRADQLIWIKLLGVERDNVLAALRFFADTGQAQPTLELAVRMGWYFLIKGLDSEARPWMEIAAGMPGEVDPDLRLLAECLLIITATAGGTAGAEEVEAGVQQMADFLERLERADVRRYPLLALMGVVIAFFGDSTVDGGQLADRALATGDPWVAASVRMFLANLAENDGDVAGMRAAAEAAHAEFVKLGERWGLASCLQLLGQLETLDGNLDAALADYLEALRLIGEIGAREDEAWLHVRVGDLHVRRGDLAAAEASVRRARVVSEATGSAREVAFSGIMLAEIARLTGDLAEARRLRDEALARMAALPPAHPLASHGLAMTLAAAAKLDLADGAVADARERLADAYRTALRTKDMPVVAGVGVVVAQLAWAQRRPIDGAEVLGAAAQLRGSPDPTHPDIRRLTGELRAALGEAAFDAAYARGRALDREAAMARLSP